jgi:uncharacterized DUF497 family protein
MRVLWDEPKRRSNLKLHRLDFVDAEMRFDFTAALIEGTYPAKDGRARFITIGPLDGDVVTLVFSLPGSEALSIISLRRASGKERKRWQSSKAVR